VETSRFTPALEAHVSGLRFGNNVETETPAYQARRVLTDNDRTITERVVDAFKAQFGDDAYETNPARGQRGFQRKTHEDVGAALLDWKAARWYGDGHIGPRPPKPGSSF
jgi:hypothetical protein